MAKRKKSVKKKLITRRNREIVFLSVLFAGLFLSMSWYLIKYVRENEQDLLNNSYNARQEILTTENYRGTIYDRNGEKLAYTEISGEREKRVYPYKNLFAHIVGYSTKGKTGIEALSNYYLINSNIPLAEKVENDIAGKKNPGNDTSVC